LVVGAPVRYRSEAPIGWVTIDSPDTMNALDDEGFRNLIAALEAAYEDTTCRAVVVNATGEHFSAGGDLDWESQFDTEAALRTTRLSTRVSYELRNAPKPLVGAVRGYCLGGGSALALHLDITIASITARFGHPETRWGLVPFWNTPQTLPLAVGLRRARALLMEGAFITAEQARAIGLCQRVVPDAHLEAEAEAIAGRLATRDPLALRATRVALNSASDALRAAANHQSALVGALAERPEYEAEVRAFFQRRPEKP
jgi:enoyl-CoA hydratase/carnithine racemase